MDRGARGLWEVIAIGILKVPLGKQVDLNKKIA